MRFLYSALLLEYWEPSCPPRSDERRKEMLFTRLASSLVAIAAAVAAPIAEHVVEGRQLSGRSKRYGTLKRAGPKTHSVEAGVDLGARWRIKIVRSSRFLYKHESNLIASAKFFSLFELRSKGDGSYLISDHAGNWVHATVPRPGEQTSLSMRKPAPPSPPPPPLPTNDAGTTLMSTAFQPPEGLSPFWLKEHPSGAFALLVDPAASTFVCQSETDLLRLAVESNSQLQSRWSVKLSGSDEFAGINASGLFELQRVIGAPPRLPLRFTATE